MEIIGSLDKWYFTVIHCSEIQLLKVGNMHYRFMVGLFVTSTLRVLMEHDGIDIIGKH